MKSPKSAWDWLEEFPPIVVRLAARRGSRGAALWIDTPEVAILSDIPLARVREFMGQLDWQGVTIEEARRFCAVCGFDPTAAPDRSAQYDYLRLCTKRNLTQPPAFLRRHPAWETEILPLLHRLKSRATSSSASNTSDSSNGRSYGRAA